MGVENINEYVIVDFEAPRSTEYGIVVTLGHKDENGDWDAVEQPIVPVDHPSVAPAVEEAARAILADQLSQTYPPDPGSDPTPDPPAGEEPS